ncbi:MAG: alpha/beta fold hydrolase [Planctomycetota bacterium JB042]
MSANLLNFALFQAGWFACVLGAADPRPAVAWIGPAAVAVLLAIHLARVEPRRDEARLLVGVAAFGFVVDSILTAADVLRYEDRLVAWLAPPWIVALWAMFASTFRHSLAWLGERPRLAFLLGAVGGPASYAAGARLGALQWPENVVRSVLVTSVVWALAVPLCLRAARRRPGPGPSARFAIALLATSTLTLGCGSLPKEKLEAELLVLDRAPDLASDRLERVAIPFRDAAAEAVVLRVPAAAPSDEPPIVFVHGTPGSFLSVAPLLEAGLAARRDVVSIDVLGHGVTRARPPEPMTFQAGADWIVATLEALALGPVALVGHSYGGEFAWRAALDRPDLVDRLVLIDSAGLPRPPGGFLPEEEKMRDWSIATHGWILNSRDRIRAALEPHLEAVDEGLLEEMFLVCENAANWRAMVELCRDENGERAHELSGMRVPTLLLWGERDLAYPPERFARGFEERIPDVRLRVLEGTGHYPNEERPDAVVAAVESFLAEERP